MRQNPSHSVRVSRGRGFQFLLVRNYYYYYYLTVFSFHPCTNQGCVVFFFTLRQSHWQTASPSISLPHSSQVQASLYHILPKSNHRFATFFPSQSTALPHSPKVQASLCHILPKSKHRFATLSTSPRIGLPRDKLQQCSVQFSSVQDGIYVLGKAHNYALQPALRSSPNVAFERIPVFV